MKQFLEGPAGTGKTTQAVEQLNQWLRTDVPSDSILVLVPQRTLGRPYQRLLWQTEIPNAASVQVGTLAGIAQRALSLYWPVVAPLAIPEWDGREPTFLNVETSQYYMTQFVEPEIQAGLFDGLSLSRPRLVTQILDELAKSAVNGFSLDEVASRLSAAWIGPSSRLRLYQTALNVAKTFRDYCLKYSLLDFSLQIDLFQKYLMPDAGYQQYARSTYRYLIADNIEEQFPVVHDFVNWLWPTLDEAALIYDTEAGYRLFLGAAPELAYQLKSRTETQSTLNQPVQQEESVSALESVLRHTFALQEIPADLPNPTHGFTHHFQTFYPQMINWVTDQVVELVKSGVEPREIVILAPFLSDALRFSIFRRLEEQDIPYISHRPSRAIRDEPAARAMIALMRIAYGTSEAMPNRGEVARALSEIIDDLDPIRAELLSQVVYRNGELSSFEKIQPPMQSRISYLIGERYENLRRWILDFRQIAATVPPDYFMQRLFDFAAHVGYRFHTNLEAGRIVAELIDSAYRFRQVIAPQSPEHWGTVADEYGRLVGEGTLAAVHDADLYQEEQNAVFVAPAYTFLMRNRMVDYQFWIDASSNAWAERLDQPLTHPYVLRRDYPAGQAWTDEQEIEARDRMLERLLLGLLRRCRKHLYLGFADLGEHGFEQRGALLRIFNHLLQVYGNEEETNEED